MSRPERDILLTGAGGFIGRGLTTELLARGKSLRALYRTPVPAGDERITSFSGDLLRPESLAAALEGIDTAYYLVHSLGAGQDRFRDLDRCAAMHFTQAADRAGVRRVIYLSGLGQRQAELSEHLDSRGEVAEILGQGRFQTTILRAAIVIGAGGASFELLRYLVSAQPFLLDSPQLQTRCQPIAKADVINYLAGCLDDERTTGESFDIGGPEIVSYRELLERLARIVGTVNLFVPTPVIPPGLVGRWVGLFSRQNSSLVTALLEGLSNEVVCEEHRIRRLIRFDLTPLDQALATALQEPDCP
jgi:uncharacterized protein YbjT (DUF2867 family)